MSGPVEAKPGLDLTQQQFGRYLVLGKGKRTGHGQFWVCQCQCPQRVGTLDIHEDALLDGRASDCGCTARTPAGRRTRLKNLIGQQFGKRLVLARAPSTRRQPMWLCRCLCGTESLCVGGPLVKYPKRQQCATCGKQQNRKIRIGRWYQDWFVMGKVAHESGYQCRCRLCGYEGLVSGSRLGSGQARACLSCMRAGVTTPLLGRRFGRWRVLHRVDKGTGLAMFRCQCSCAAQTIRTVRLSSLLRGDSESCGCRSHEAARDVTLREIRQTDANIFFTWTLDVLQQHARYTQQMTEASGRLLTLEEVGA